jgi:putative glutamine amidotransferase
MPDRPLIGITVDVQDTSALPAGSSSPAPSLRLDCRASYVSRIAAAGGLPILLPPEVSRIADYARVCDAFILTGGDDPRTEPFGQPTHSAAALVHPCRQAFETALLRELESSHPRKPVLGICLGMQMMALLGGGRLNQHLPDTCATAALHRSSDPGTRARHSILVDPAAAAAGFGWLLAADAVDEQVDSHHHQAVEAPGDLVVLARAADGVIEAIGAPAPARPFYLGVQWHPERTESRALGMALFEHLVAAASRRL